MGTRKQSFAVDEYYHLYSRGVEKRTIFLDKKDHEYFLYLMDVCNTEKSIKIRDLGRSFDRGDTIVDIGAYCLMPNHFHILVREKIENGISKYMLKLLTAYSMYFNAKHERTGRLYESTFKSSYIDTDEYLKYMYTYIHLNPAKLIDKNWKEKLTKSISELLKFVFDYPYSSIQEFAQSNSGLKRKILNPTVFPSYFTKPLDNKRELFDWLSISDTTYSYTG